LQPEIAKNVLKTPILGVQQRVSVPGRDTRNGQTDRQTASP